MQKKTILLMIAIFGFLTLSKAQSFTEIQQDSLMTIWEDQTQQDTIRLNAIQRIAMEGYRFKNPDSALYYAQLQYDFALTTKHKNFQALALNTQGDYYLLKGDPDKALDVFNLALKISEEINNKRTKLITLGNISRVYGSKGNLEKALDYNLQILKISEDIQDKIGIGRSLADIGKNYARKGDLKSGLAYLKRSKNIFEELDDKNSIARVRSFIANVYMQQGNLDEALKLITINLAYFEDIGNKTLAAGCLSNLGGIYINQGDTKKALQYLEKALVHFEEIGNIPYVAKLSQNMGQIYYDQGNLERALEYTTKSLKLSEIIKDENTQASAKQKIAIIFAEQRKYTQAISYGNEALIFYQKTGDVIGVSATSGNLTKSYKAIGNYKKAFQMNNLHYKMRDSLNSKENQKAIIELQIQSNYEKQKAIDDLENQKEIAIQEAKTKAQQRISWAIGIGLLLTSLLAIVILNKLKVTRKQKVIIEAQKKKVEQSEKYKEQFLANMSHEIRTPMHAISGMTKILERNDHPKSQDVFLKAMRTSSDNLVVILNDVLDLSKIEAGKLEIENISLNLEAVIENINQILKYKAEEKGLILAYEISENVPTLIMGDPTRLNQILINLVGNAIKFTKKGSINILVSVMDNQLHFEIKDTGIGISKDKHEGIFDAFKQAKESTTRYYGGTGLGLNISKQLVDLQDGRIWVESIEGEGSTFYFELPLTIPEANAVSQNFISGDKLKTMAKSLKGIRVLIAEDNPFNQMIAQDDLSYYIEDISLETVENGVLAIEKFKTNTFDVILMDVQMPEMNGFEATKNIREIETLEGRPFKIPIIAMTASLLKTEIDSCYAAGMDNYIPKPYKLEELIVPIFKELKS
jgi:signal transduction histidine kinase/predicted negative regulator of RcsB-dependent stress response/ActR/RegA family two-component response regulator